jgi:hypothetical protein
MRVRGCAEIKDQEENGMTIQKTHRFLLATFSSVGAAIPVMPALGQSSDGQMMLGSSWGGMMFGMDLFSLLGIAVLVLVVVALAKYILRG